MQPGVLFPAAADDELLGGVQHVQIAKGNLALRPFAQQDAVGYSSTDAISQSNASLIAWNAGTPSVGFEQAGHTCMFVRVGTAVGSFAVVAFRFRGKVLALNMCPLAQATYGFDNVSLDIDGMTYDVPQACRQPNFDWAPPNSDPRNYYPIADDLPDGTHWARLFFASDPAALVSQSWDVYGFYEEERVGARPAAPTSILAAAGILVTSTARTGFSSLLSGTTNWAVALSAVSFVNTSASPVQVILDYFASGAELFRKIVAANSTEIFALPLAASLLAPQLAITCDTANAIKVSAFVVNR